jgi:hypothetical protein
MSGYSYVIFIPVLSILLFQGCTLIGFSAGLGIESLIKTEYDYPTEKLYRLHKEQHMELVLMSNDRHYVQFIKFHRTSRKKYADKHINAVRLYNLEGQIPFPDEMVYAGDDTAVYYRFVAFEFQKIILRHVNSKGIITYDLNKLSSLKSIRGQSYNLEEIKRLMQKNKIPFFTELKVDANGEELLIPIETIVYLRLLNRQPSSCAAGFMFIGLLIDWHIYMFLGNFNIQ